MKVEDRLRILNRALRSARSTPCGVCGHAYHEHVRGLRCYGIRCRCKEFNEPEAAA